MTIRDKYPILRPSLNLDFANSKVLDPRITFTRASTGTFYNASGLLASAANNVARFDHNPVTGESLGLLIEEQRTNLLTRSEEFNDVIWTKSDATVVPNVIIAPDGVTSAEKIVATTATAFHNAQITPSVTTTVSCSVYAKKGEYNFCSLIMVGSTIRSARTFNLTTGEITNPFDTNSTFISAQAVDVGNGWWRLTLSATSAQFDFFRIGLAVDTINNHSNNGQTFAGDGVSGIYLWGAQVEAGSFATSYIPTVASQVTRNADVASMTGTNFTSWYRQDEGTLFAQTQRNGSSSTADEGAGIEVTDGSIQSNMMQLMYDNGSFNSAALRVFPGVGSFAIRSSGGSPNYIPGEPARTFAAAYKSANSGMSVSGTAVTTDTTVYTPPPVTFLSIRTASNGIQGSDFNGTIRRIIYYPIRLSNNQLRGITA